MTARLVDGLAAAVLLGSMIPSASASDWPWRRKADPGAMNTPEQIARSIDALEDKALDDGVVVVKRPDVWGQNRMTLYRRDFESSMKSVLTSGSKEAFATVLSARVARSDQAAFSSQSVLAGALTSTKPGGGGGGNVATQIVTTPAQITGATTTNASGVSTSTLGDAGTLQQKLLGITSPSTTPGAVTLPGAPIKEGTANAVTAGAPFSLLNQNSAGTPSAFGAVTQTSSGFGSSLEPTIVLDEKKRWLDHLNEIRRVNIGDDVSDSAGYGLYLFRMPVSLQPGECTVKGHGAVLTATLRPQFTPNFLRDTFRRLVIADVLDQLGPVIYELIRTGKTEDIAGSQESASLQNLIHSFHLASYRNGTRAYPIGPGEIGEVFITRNLLVIARQAKATLITQVPNEADVRAYLRHEIEAAYEQFGDYESRVSRVAECVADREYRALRQVEFPMLAGELKGDLKGSTNRILPALCWAIAVDAGLLDRRLKDDMAATAGQAGFAPPPDLPAYDFYSSRPTPRAEAVFEGYVRARWPIVTFALDPVTDQQNIGDAYSQRRDLQLALAYSFAAGRINFGQLNQFSRHLEKDAETIALNRTVSAFSHGSETFGWRFYPRFQNPPEERNNLQTMTNLLLRGGPGRDYQSKNSKLEAGQRELTVVVVMPAFLEQVRFDVNGNWFPLHDPDQMKIHTARMIAQGRRVTEIRQALASASACGHYRPGDLERLSERLDQLEAKLPLQTLKVDVPYETTAAGFQLFTPGSNALAPQLLGYQGVNRIPATFPAGMTNLSLFLLGKHLSIHETRVVMGGQTLPLNPSSSPDGTSFNFKIVSRDVIQVNLTKDAKPSVLTVGPDGTNYVEAYVATPDGISNRLLIPYGDPPAPSVPGFAFANGELTASSDYSRVIPTSAPPSLKLTSASGVVSPSYKVRFLVQPTAGIQGGLKAIELANPIVLNGTSLAFDGPVLDDLKAQLQAALPTVSPGFFDPATKTYNLILQGYVLSPDGSTPAVKTTNTLILHVRSDAP